jgi:hypothetical protein
MHLLKVLRDDAYGDDTKAVARVLIGEFDSIE